MRISRSSLKDRLEDIEVSVLSGSGISPAVFGIYESDGDGNLGRHIHNITWRKSGFVETDQPATAKFPAIMEPFFFPKRNKTAFGGRGSSKTRSAVTVLVELARMERHIIYCCREIKENIEESIHQDITAEIHEKGYEDEFDIKYNKIRHKLTKTIFRFKGLYRNNTQGLKSLSRATILVIDEADSVSEEAWDTLKPTMRDSRSEIWCLFNPRLEDDATYQQRVKPYIKRMSGNTFEDDKRVVIKVNWQQNTFFPQVLRDEKDEVKAFNRNKYLHVWEGEFKRPDNEKIKPEWWNFFIDLEEVQQLSNFRFITADTAYTSNKDNDMTVFTAWACEGSKRLYVVDQIAGHWEFPDLVKNAKAFWSKHHKVSSGRRQKGFYIEAKASGLSLVQTLRKHGINSIPWKPKDYNYPDDKVGRVDQTAWNVYSGDLWLPEYLDENEEIIPGMEWVKDTVKEGQLFTEDDSHDSDDRLDTITMGVSIWTKYGGGSKMKGKAA